MHFYKYGILMDRRSTTFPTKWRIALFDGHVNGHGFIEVPEILFDFTPTPGNSVKVKFKNEFNDVPLIFMIICFTEECLERTFLSENNSYYIVENNDTDFKKVAVPERIFDNAKRCVSPLQKLDEPKVYRAGVLWDPIVLEGVTVNWRYYNDFPLVPVFELYFRDSTLPYLSESMVYGVLEGIVIAINENGALYWTRGIGCAILPSVTRDSLMPALGSVNSVLARRCLPETSFGFPCSYELLPETRNHKWEGIRIVPDEMSRCVYIQLTCECVLSKEVNTLAMMIPHIGTVFRGLSGYKNKLRAGENYKIRVEFQKDLNSYHPVVMDVCLVPFAFSLQTNIIIIVFQEEDEFVQCRVVHISRETKNYYAVLEPGDTVFDSCKHSIDYIKIPFRVMFCAKGIYVEDEQLLTHCFNVRIRRPRKNHDIVSAVHVLSYIESRKDPVFATLNKTVWLRTMVKKEKDDPSRVTELICPRLEQKVLDPSRLSANMPINMLFAVHAQFTLISENIPVFLIRNVAPTIHQLPRVTSQIAASLPPLQSESSFGISSDQSQRSDCSSLSSSSFSRPDVNPNSEITLPSNPLLPRRVHRSSFNTACESEDEDGSDISLSRESNRSSYQSSDDIVMTESWLASSAASIASDVLDSSLSSFSTVSFDTPLKPLVFETPLKPPVFETPLKPLVLETPFKPLAVERKQLDFVSHFEPKRAVPGFNAARGLGFGPSNYLSSGLTRNQGSGSLANKPPRRTLIKYGYRQLKSPKSHRDVLFDIVYKFLKTRPMFIENEREAMGSWFRPPSGKRMCRFSGFAVGLKQLMFYSEQPSHHISNIQTMETSFGHEYLRFTTKVARPCVPEIDSDVFEIWSCEHLPGYVIVEKKKDLLKLLEPLDPDENESHVYSAVIEPVAGGPMEISILKNFKDTDHIDIFVFWRLVMEFSDDVPIPELVRRKDGHRECHGPSHIPEPPDHTINKFGMWETLHLNSVLAQEKLDLLRSLNDPRVKLVEGPDLKPEIEVRKVHVDLRRKCMFGALSSFLKLLPSLKDHQMFNFVFEEDFVKKIEELQGYDDGLHPTQIRKRSYSLKLGLNYMSEILLRNEVYLRMYEETEFAPLLQEMADCIDLNATYIKQTDEVKKMLLFFRKHKMIPVT
ncbi:hypothetical protein CAEBREN_30825 [Caenorhabditis brenneri]|uniref:Uncharacterized protein n=1 Tax=Caenorhabditis brenneri TaxID=135651 RepID=G0PCP2_CAEBE|nr:hypothetical protein CAEBREN_30825 [Caenorhabditis brenneri]